MKILNSFFVLTFALVFAGCNKDDDDDDIQTQHKYRLKSVDYVTFHGIANYFYNTDSTIKKIQYSNGVTGYDVSFDYQNEQVSLVSVSSSLYEHRYTYSNGKIVTVTDTQMGRLHIGNKFVYSYNNDGTVSELKYYDLNEAGETLVYTSTYEYNSMGLPSKITSVNGNNKVIWTIESYSDICEFNEWTFIGISLNELYELYNYPVLTTMNKLPKKIVQTVQTGSATPTVQKIIESEYTIHKQRLDKLKTSISFPKNPNYNTSSEVLFNYE